MHWPWGFISEIWQLGSIWFERVEILVQWKGIGRQSSSKVTLSARVSSCVYDTVVNDFGDSGTNSVSHEELWFAGNAFEWENCLRNGAVFEAYWNAVDHSVFFLQSESNRASGATVYRLVIQAVLSACRRALSFADSESRLALLQVITSS